MPPETLNDWMDLLDTVVRNCSEDVLDAFTKNMPPLF